eukprot:TRINITY_DN2894_c0_g1_i2.p1 TRINITY_DN2894_c0_g1~~TRINITY_DN2894_c0_g1_i2.p1  ORF type:complete len:1114 (+),score=267.19 TRINITY_DN2894_c0_g1_i2:219-3344(+)
MYFLLIAVLQLSKNITPVDPKSTWFPLAFIFSITALKEAFDDYHRYKADKKANEKLYDVFHPDGRLKKIQSQHIRVGDIVCLYEDDEVPADMVLITSASKGLCHIQTANVDGETDFKLRTAPAETMHLTKDEVTSLTGLYIECQPPNAEIYRFDSRLSMTRGAPDKFSLSTSHQWSALTDKQLLLQATHVRNTEWVCGVVVYTGNQTKVGQNMRNPSLKMTKQDKVTNHYTLFVFGFQLLLVVVFGLIGNYWQQRYMQKAWYLDIEPEMVWWKYLIIPTRFLLLNSLMIPISLKVSLDIVKYCNSKIIEWDIELYDEETDTPATATNTAISEDLGAIEYVFTDKTGTLTENKMIFSKCSIEGLTYGNSLECNNALTDFRLQRALAEQNENIIRFFRTLALCHTVATSRHNDQIVYRASSPDEEALVKAASQVNIVFERSEGKIIYLDVLGEKKVYERILALDFTSDRKRMSVIVKDESGNIQLLTKGADDVIVTRLAADQAAMRKTTQAHIDQFAELGLRTLCVAYRNISEEELLDWLPIYRRASTALEGRDEELANAFELMEKNLILIGATAIEDKLQHKVPETIHSLRRAGIKIWMLTGDKYSTAVQIATSCNLISSNVDLLLSIRGDDVSDVNISIGDIQHRARRIIQSGNEFSLIIEGHSLRFALDQACKRDFLELAVLATSVICCRVSPQEKALVVAMIKNNGCMTLSIGDGGNDVSMIQEANVGIGIAGREGLQAARAADYAFGKFYMLKRLMLVHGRYGARRTGFTTQYCNWKAFIICFIQILYQTVTGVSGTSFFNTFSLTIYNIAYTGIPVLFYVLDKDHPEYYLMSNPILYRDCQKNKFFNYRTLFYWFTRALFQGIVVFTFTVLFYHDSIERDGVESNSGYDSMSNVAYTSLILINTFTILLESRNLTWINHFIIWGCLATYWASITVLNLFPTLNVIPYDVMNHLFRTPLYWLTVLISTLMALLPVYLLNWYGVLAMGPDSPLIYQLNDTINQPQEEEVEREFSFQVKRTFASKSRESIDENAPLLDSI